MFEQIRFLPKENIHGRLLPWVIGVMVFLSGLAVSIALALEDTTSAWRDDLSRELSVQIVHPDRETRLKEAEAAVAALQDIDGIESAVVTTDEEVAALLEPWLGSGNVTPELPIPVLIRVTLLEGAVIGEGDIAAAIADVAPAARVDGHEQWLSDLLVLAQILQWISAFVVGLVVVATVAIIIFATRAGLAAQRETVEIVHTMGAPDNLIASAFQRRFLFVGLTGGVYGLGILAVVFLILMFAASGLGAAWAPEMTPSLSAIAVLLLLPLPAALITMLTARFTVIRALGEMV